MLSFCKFKKKKRIKEKNNNYLTLFINCSRMVPPFYLRKDVKLFSGPQ